MGVRLRPRLLPIVVIAATTLLGFKISVLLPGNGAGVAPAAHAQAASAQPSAPPAASQPAQTAADTPAEPNPAGSASMTDPQALNASELEVLQRLAQRRAALDQRAGELDQREVLLQATEKRIDDKIAKLQQLQSSIASDVQKRSAEDDARIQSLVKIYEAMKPKDAAQIFEQLDMPVLLSVLERMKELKTAPILAAMDPVKAKSITTALAAKRSPDAGKVPTGAAAAKL